MTATAPAAEYQRRLDSRRTELARLARIDTRLSHLRVVSFAIAVVVVVFAWNGSIQPWWLAGPIIAFAALVIRHDRVIREQAAATRAVELYQRGLARIEDRWAGTGEDGARFQDEQHPYATDLDLFGNGSLFQLLCSARTAAGEETLARWLLHPATVDQIAARHEAVAELTPALDFREALAIAGSRVRSSVDSAALVAWAESPRLLRPPWLRWLTHLAPLVSMAAIPLSVLAGDLRVFAAALIVQVLIAFQQLRRTGQVLATASAAARDLEVLSQLLAQLQHAPFAAARLVELRRRLDTGGSTATQSVRRMLWFVELQEWLQNPVFAPIAALLLWGIQLAWLIESWRQRHGAHVRAWLAAAGEVEALASLAAYRYEHPDDPFPELIVASPIGRDVNAGAVAGFPPPPGAAAWRAKPRSAREGLPLNATFEGLGLAHPLLPAAAAVRNDVRFAGDTRLLVVSGSNMSGKSTLLRTVGINAVLALAGAPVRAAALRLTPVAIGATLRIQDSLQAGRSRFYAEITRVRLLAGIADGPLPLLFLLDELFHGTNSHDRVAGAAGVLRSLLRKEAIGLVTTHDLALTAVTDTLAPQAVNVHFEDWFDGGEMRFDYRMKPGPVRHSNALALMRAVGLRVQKEGTR